MDMGIPADRVENTDAVLIEMADVEPTFGVSPDKVSPGLSHNAALLRKGKRPKGALLREHELEAVRLLQQRPSRTGS